MKQYSVGESVRRRGRLELDEFPVRYFHLYRFQTRKYGMVEVIGTDQVNERIRKTHKSIFNYFPK